jgi:uncharacterized protein
MKYLITTLCLFTSLFAKYEEPWGSDTQLLHQPSAKTQKQSVAARAAHKVIKFHQKVLSPTTGPRSSFRPTSSKYMELAIKRYGFFKGFIMGCDRLLRENNEEWIYPKIEAGGRKYKFDPARLNKR